MNKKYGNCFLETDDFKFIWGLKSWYDLSSSDANMFTMNDIDIIYDKQKRNIYLELKQLLISKIMKQTVNILRDV